ncbi:hypothetical protein JTE90_010540 [Oedothorax gibbosus]|uniref:Putative hydroxypyruvate isomerase n=1 Tax=Oedothorax gibbosus TaxID=931172 RepID=A0AAV6TPS6_9ARAC|nr:hypothetical protein JTE90_010540 [Oedothorax gibbosus]
MRFAANVSMMFQNIRMLDRFQEAKRLGFSAIEAQWLYDFLIKDLREAREAADIPIVLINSPKCFEVFEPNSVGMACIPDQELNFLHSINLAVDYCKSLKCSKLHIMAGNLSDNSTFEECEQKYIKNLKTVSELLKLHNITGVIEPICKQVLPNYFMNSYENAVKYIKEVNSENIKLLLDVFHLHNIEGNVEEGVLKYLPYAGHIQVSQAPKRNEPFAEGPINYKNVFDILKTCGYTGEIGLEYIPTGPVPDFEWIKECKF